MHALDCSKLNNGWNEQLQPRVNIQLRLCLQL